MRTPFRGSIIVLTAVIMAICAATAYADSNHDPHIIINDPPSCSGSLCNVGNHFSFSIPGNTTVQIGSSTSNPNWFQLLISWNPAQNGVPVLNVTGGVGTTGVTKFWDWKRVIISPTDVGILFYSARPDTDPESPYYGNLPPIAPGSVITLKFTPGGGSWPPTTFTGQANPPSVPEPATMIMVFSGILGIASRRKFWNRAA